MFKNTFGVWLDNLDGILSREKVRSGSWSETCILYCWL